MLPSLKRNSTPAPRGKRCCQRSPDATYVGGARSSPKARLRSWRDCGEGICDGQRCPQGEGDQSPTGSHRALVSSIISSARSSARSSWITTRDDTTPQPVLRVPAHLAAPNKRHIPSTEGIALKATPDTDQPEPTTSNDGRPDPREGIDPEKFRNKTGQRRRRPKPPPGRRPKIISKPLSKGWTRAATEINSIDNFYRLWRCTVMCRAPRARITRTRCVRRT